MNWRLLFYTCLVLLSATACRSWKDRKAAGSDELDRECGQIIADTRRSMGLDSRESICEVSTRIQDDTCYLQGFVTDRNFSNRITEALEFTGWDVKDLTTVLPDTISCPKRYALTALSVTNLMKEPRPSAELMSQCLMGTPVQILDMKDHWMRVRTPDEYIGWIFEKDLRMMTKDEFRKWRESRRIMITSPFVQLKESSGALSAEAIWGNIIETAAYQEQETFNTGETVDGRFFRIGKGEAIPFQVWSKQSRPSPEALVNTARKLVGIPYLWGGASLKAVDGGGLIHLIFYLNGVIVKRDADLLAKYGREISVPADLISIRMADLADLRKGDLLFFGDPLEGDGSISHVGIYIGKGEFIHASSSVRISSLLRGNTDYYGATSRLMGIRRYTDRIDQENGIISIARHPDYVSR